MQLTPTERVLARVLQIERRLEDPNMLVGVRRTVFKGSPLQRAVSALIVSLLFGCLVPLAIVTVVSRAAGESSSLGLALKEIYLFSAEWILADASSFISVSIALMTAGLSAAIAVAALARARFQADLDNKIYLSSFSQYFNLGAAIYFSFHLMLCTGWLAWRDQDGGNISIFVPEVATIGWILTLLLASISVADIAVLKQRRDRLAAEEQEMSQKIPYDYQYRPLPLFNLINLTAFSCTLLMMLVNAALAFELIDSPARRPLLLAVFQFLLSIITSYIMAWIYFMLNPNSSPFSSNTFITKTCRVLAYTIAVFSLASVAALNWEANAPAYLISFVASIVIYLFTPILIGRSRLAKDRFLTARNNILMERTTGLRNAMAITDRQISEI